MISVSLERSMSGSLTNFQMKYMMELLGNVVKSGKHVQVMKELQSQMSPHVPGHQLRRLLFEKGSLTQNDAAKVVEFICLKTDDEVNSQIEVARLEQHFEQVKKHWLEQSEAVKKVK